MSADQSSLAPRPTQAPKLAPPPRSCDSHAHIFGPPARFPLAADASYTPPAATVEEYLAALGQLGIERGVLVQPAPYGEDNAAMLDALRHFPDRLRGIALASSGVSDATLGEFKSYGVCGLRFSYFPVPGQNVATIGLQELQRMAPRLRDHGLHAQLWLPCEEFAANAPMLLGLGIPLVLDHLTRVRPAAGLNDPAFRTLLSVLQNEDVWLKLTPHRASAAFPDYADIRPFHEAALATRPDRLLWGTDWPFVRMGAATPDAGHLLDLFSEWTTDAALQQAILVDNPAQLYGFDA